MIFYVCLPPLLPPLDHAQTTDNISATLAANQFKQHDIFWQGAETRERRNVGAVWRFLVREYAAR